MHLLNRAGASLGGQRLSRYCLGRS
jgi:hypothetical protein